MKTVHWIVLLAGLLVLCAALSLAFFSGSEASAAEVWSGGQLLRTVPLAVDQEFTVTLNGQTNTVTVQGGRIAVTAASCPDGYCMGRGFCAGGAQIVCLPNRLVIKFTAQAEVDGVVG